MYKYILKNKIVFESIMTEFSSHSLVMVSRVGGLMGLGPDTVREGAGEDFPLPFVGDFASLPFPFPTAFC